jgi:putative FmdB family regulatory protein
MPIYEYRCKRCGETVEVIQRAKDKPLEKCQKCGGALVKLICSPAIQFKGNGWYVTDYAKKSPPAPDSKPAPATETGKEKKDKSKPSRSSSE